jgi:hypothetical protein
MGRSLEVRRKSENLPIVGRTLIETTLLQWVAKGDVSVLASWNAGVAQQDIAELL